MRTTFKATAVAVVAAMCLAGSGAPARQKTMGDVALERLATLAHERGWDAATLFRSPQSIRTVHASGAITVEAMPAEQAIRRIGDRMPAARPRERGVAGPFELNAGALAHGYLDVRPFGGAHELYVVTASAAGDVSQIKGGDWTIGGHGAGGTNIDTASSGPYLPGGMPSLVPDQSVDFLGNVEMVEQVVVCLPFFGCVLAIGAFAGEGVTLFDNTGPAGIPQLP